LNLFAVVVTGDQAFFFFISQVTVVVANVRYNTLVNNKLKAVPLPTDAATQSVETNPFTKGINIFFSFV